MPSRRAWKLARAAAVLSAAGLIAPYLGDSASGQDGAGAPPPSRPSAPEPEAWWTPTAEQSAHAEQTQQPLWFDDAQGMRFVLIPPWTFTMGKPANEIGGGTTRRRSTR